MSTAAAALRTLTAEEAAIGPRLEIKVRLEGQAASALLDTGSPVTIVSLKCLLQYWKQSFGRDRPNDEWLKEVNGKLTDPTLHLETYDGTPVELLAETTVALGIGDKEIQLRVFVQDDAPQEILIGTDCLHLLGGAVTIDGSPVLQLGGSTKPEMPKAVVRLIKSVKIPAHHLGVVSV